MQLGDIPNKGSVTLGYYDYTWKRTSFDTLLLSKSADADDPHYEAEVKFPNNVIDYADADNWDVTIASIDQDGGEYLNDPAYIDQFESLFAYFEQKFLIPIDPRPQV